MTSKPHAPMAGPEPLRLSWFGFNGLGQLRPSLGGFGVVALARLGGVPGVVEIYDVLDDADGTLVIRTERLLEGVIGFEHFGLCFRESLHGREGPGVPAEQNPGGPMAPRMNSSGRILYQM